jgi:hypothetical protein
VVNVDLPTQGAGCGGALVWFHFPFSCLLYS